MQTYRHQRRFKLCLWYTGERLNLVQKPWQRHDTLLCRAAVLSLILDLLQGRFQQHWLAATAYISSFWTCWKWKSKQAVFPKRRRDKSFIGSLYVTLAKWGVGLNLPWTFWSVDGSLNFFLTFAPRLLRLEDKCFAEAKQRKSHFILVQKRGD